MKYPKFLAFKYKIFTFGTWRYEGLKEGYAGDSALGRTDIASFSVEISAAQEGSMMSFIAGVRTAGAEAWQCWSPCSDFASDLFRITTGINLQDRHWFGIGYSDPNILYNSIKSH